MTVPYLYLAGIGVWLLVWVWRDVTPGRAGRFAAVLERLGLRGDR